ncbi:Atxe2 family lasso peptide isopeptidase [Novosphingobium sp. PS1R-30]|uniref:Atxe2 family lasso peptide isopeptidase n=1 Tax=Novosphingobium anseongense TaxID=3133436 RepID=A0ABU8S1B8_9SPHN
MAASRLVTPDDIIRLRDVGHRDVISTRQTPLGVSPDGKRLAFVISRAQIATNDYCRALVVVDLAPGTGSPAEPRVVDRGGELIKVPTAVRGLVQTAGAPDMVTPVWSPDGRSIAYRKRIDGRTEAWVAAADGSGARAVARLDGDVIDLAWDPDGARLLLTWQPGLVAQRAAIAREALSGYLYDDRFQPTDRPEPLLQASPLVGLSVDLASGRRQDLGADETAKRFPNYRPGLPVPLDVRSQGGIRARLTPVSDDLRSEMRIVAAMPDGSARACLARTCSGSIPLMFWIGETLVFLRQEGWAKGTYALYGWRPDRDAPQKIVAGEDLLSGCLPAAGRIVCMTENATTTRRIVTIDVADGLQKTVFDPNPEFGAIRLGTVKRLAVRNAVGREAWGDLVLPPGYRGGRLPLVIVQYRSRGFLRGGVGAEYPIHAFAARGMAVLSFERPDPLASGKTEAEQLGSATRDWGDRRSVNDALDRVIDEAVRLGVADPSRIGMTGLSDGATTTAFSLLNSRYRIAAAAVSSLAMEPQTVMTVGGTRWADSLKAQGYPPMTKDDPTFWAPMSLTRNASRIDTPILVQPADHEYTLSLEAWTALREADKPVEMFVFPDEYHNKWQPAHLTAVYERSLDWMDYWLLGKRDADPAKAPQYARWDALKVLADRPKSAGS